MQAVEHRGNALAFAAEDLQADREAGVDKFLHPCYPQKMMKGIFRGGGQKKGGEEEKPKKVPLGRFCFGTGKNPWRVELLS